METRERYATTGPASSLPPDAFIAGLAMPIHVDLPTLERLQADLEAARQTIASLEARITSMSVTHDALCVELGAAEIEAAQERTARRRAMDELESVRSYVIGAMDDAAVILCECERQRHAARLWAAAWKQKARQWRNLAGQMEVTAAELGKYADGLIGAMPPAMQKKWPNLITKTHAALATLDGSKAGNK